MFILKRYTTNNNEMHTAVFTHVFTQKFAVGLGVFGKGVGLGLKLGAGVIDFVLYNLVDEYSLCELIIL
jgi:hypothetical protein